MERGFEKDEVLVSFDVHGKYRGQGLDESSSMERRVTVDLEGLSTE